MTEDYEVTYRIKELGVSREQLADAVKKVGVSVSAIRAELDKRRGKQHKARRRASRPGCRCAGWVHKAEAAVYE